MTLPYGKEILYFTENAAGQVCFLFSKWPERITGGLGSEISQGMGFFSSSFMVMPPFAPSLGGKARNMRRKDDGFFDSPSTSLRVAQNDMALGM